MNSYIKTNHFADVLSREGLNPDHFENKERLSSKAYLYSKFDVLGYVQIAKLKD